MTDTRTATTPPPDPGSAPRPEPGPAPGRALPPDPAAYDAPRNVHARARGLPAAYIAGGTDPDPAPGRREERFWLRILLAMVIFLVVGGFVFGILFALLAGGS